MADADAVSVPRELLRILRRHPRQLPERLMLFAVRRLGAPTRTWAQGVRGEGGEAEAAGLAGRCAEEVRATIAASRVDGAVAGTPFFIALVPAYVAFLWAQARMTLRIAALQGRDTADEAIAAELLALRGVYGSVEEAATALAHLEQQPPTPSGWRERGVVWFELVRRILVLAAFAGPSSPEGARPSRARQLLLGAFGVAIWLSTWVLPVTFMVVMAWGCERSTRELGAIALDYYGVGAAAEAGPSADASADATTEGVPGAALPPGRLGPGAPSPPGRLARAREPRRLPWSLIAGLSVLAPLGVIALAASTHVHHGPWVAFVAPLAGLALVLAIAARQRT
jgi:hypothetical protein